MKSGRAGAQKSSLAEEIRRIEREKPAPIPMAMGITDGDYRFEPDGPGDEPAPGKGVKREAIEGSFLHRGPGRYQAPPSYFLISRRLPEPRTRHRSPGFLSVVSYGKAPAEIPPADGHTSGRRRALAEWLGSPENPLTARVMVNRIWHHHFGRGIVPTLDNFGKMGEKADASGTARLAGRRIHGPRLEHQRHAPPHDDVGSVSDGVAVQTMANAAKDPDNTYQWRFRIQRMDAEIVRDTILQASGALNSEMFGPAVSSPSCSPRCCSPMNKGIWEREEDGPKSGGVVCTSIASGDCRFPSLRFSICPIKTSPASRRNVSTVPTQALTLLNDDFVLRQAQLFADRVRESAPAGPRRRLSAIYEIALRRSPTDSEQRLALDFLRKRKLVDFTHVLLNLNEFLYLR